MATIDNRNETIQQYNTFQNDIMGTEISLAEVAKKLRKLKNGKATE